jgi:hypothetical protein
VRSNRSSLVPIVMVSLGALLMIGALLWFVIVTRQSSKRVAIPPTPVASSITPVASPAIPYPDIKRISLADAKAAFELKSAVFVDVRGEPYFSEGHIPGAISLTYDELSSRMGELDKNAWIIFYCT